jgi:hypothetical protein
MLVLSRKHPMPSSKRVRSPRQNDKSQVNTFNLEHHPCCARF